jgi:glycosyltransferase involved in cell wall biosynthesis
LLSALLPRVRHRYTEHNSPPNPAAAEPSRGPKEWVKLALMRRYERIYGISDFVLRARAGHFPRDRAVRWFYFINTDRFAPDPNARDEQRARMGVREGQFVISVLANLIPQKGVDVTIRSLRQLPPEFVLWVLGAGHHKEALQGLAAELGLTDRVRFLGMNYNVTPFIQAADCLNCPSVWGEAVGLVNLEGMACGTPVVASAVGGIPEFIRDGVTGLLAPPGDVDALAGAFRRLHEDPALRAALGRQARAAALRDHSPAGRLDGQIAEYVSRNRS